MRSQSGDEISATHRWASLASLAGWWYRGQMGKRSKAPVDVPTVYEIFLYLLAELEQAVDRGVIEWSAASAEAAQHRLDKLSAELSRIASKLRVN